MLGGRCRKTGPAKRECLHDHIHSVEAPASILGGIEAKFRNQILVGERILFEKGIEKKGTWKKICQTRWKALDENYQKSVLTQN